MSDEVDFRTLVHLATTRFGKAVVARSSGVSRDTLYRYLDGEDLSPPKLAQLREGIAALEAAERDALNTMEVDFKRPPRRFTAHEGLPYEVRTWLQAELLDYMRARVPDEQLESAERLYRSPEVFSFYAGGMPRARSEEDVLKTMRAIAVVVRTELRRRGYDVEPDTPH